MSTEEPFFFADGTPATGEWYEDVAHLQGFIEELAVTMKTEIAVPAHRLFFALSNADRVLRTNLRIPSPSVFKRAAAFLVGFMIESPIDEPFGPVVLGDKSRVPHIGNHQNAIVAFEYARSILTGATYARTEAGLKIPVTLDKPIKLSTHFYVDLIHSLTAIPRDPRNSTKSHSDYPIPVFHTLALLIEGLCYWANHDAVCHDELNA